MNADTSAIANINMPVVKAGTAIGAAVTANTDAAQSVAYSAAHSVAHDPQLFNAIISIPWASIASMLAAIYTGVLLCEWMWKKAFRPLFVEFGWLKPTPRRVFTAQEIELLEAGDTDSGAP